MTRRAAFGCGAAVVCLLAVCVLPVVSRMGGVYVEEFVVSLALGWWTFGWSVLPRAEVDSGPIISTVICLGLLLVGTHLFASWVHRNWRRPGDEGDATPQRWAKRWTFGVVSIVVLMFAAGIAAIGTTHQAYWLVSSKDPSFLDGHWSSSFYISDVGLKELCQDLWDRAAKKGWTAAQTGLRAQAEEKYHADEIAYICIDERPGGRLGKIVAFPRDTSRQRDAGVVEITAVGAIASPKGELDAILGKLR